MSAADDSRIMDALFRVQDRTIQMVERSYISATHGRCFMAEDVCAVADAREALIREIDRWAVARRHKAYLVGRQERAPRLLTKNAGADAIRAAWGSSPPEPEPDPEPNHVHVDGTRLDGWPCFEPCCLDPFVPPHPVVGPDPEPNHPGALWGTPGEDD